MGKLMFWAVTVVGLAPVTIACLSSLYALIWLPRMGLPRRYATDDSLTYVHDVYVIIGSGPWQISIAPSWWTVVVCLTGVVFVLIGLGALMRSSAA